MTSVARRREPDDSGEYSDTSQDIEQNNSGNDGQHESYYDSQGSDSDRSDPEIQDLETRDPEIQDSEKQEAERRVDDDEDRSNPQYIPKRGTFYEHDDRTAASGEEPSDTNQETASEKKEGSETPSDRRRPPRKSDTLNKWSHDKYNENEQMPKSRDELVAIYGYDIRNEDAPPHARRNRRYGRGPNKYTRTWEDEEAYKRQVAQTPHKKPPSPADFPELNAVNKPGKPRPRPRSKSQPASNESSESGSQLRRNASIKVANPKQKPVKPTVTRREVDVKPTSQPPKQPLKDKIHIPLENLTITTTVNNTQGPPQRKVNAAVAQQRPVPTEQNKKKPLVTQPPLQSNAAKQPPQQQKPPSQQPQPPQQQQQATAGGEPRGGSKRYSNLRQRPLAETYSPQQQPPQTQQPPPPTQQQPTQPPQQQQQQLQQQQQQPPPQQQQPQPQQQHRYHGEFVGGQPPQHQGSPGPQMHPQQIMHPVHRNAVAQPPHGPSPPHQPLPQPQHTQQQVRLGILDQQQIVQHPHHTMHNMPQPHAIGQLQPAQGYAPPAMMPAQYMQQGGSGGVFGAAPIYQPPAAYPHQLYPHHNFGTQAGGVTYYTCTEQEQPPRQPRRPTAAIPIVRPAHPERPANSSEKDNIDRIVENMFVRKPWPAHGADVPKDKAQDSRNSQEPQSKETSQPNSLSSSSISTDSKPERTEKTEKTESENPDSAEA
ncbi:protein CASC3-like isoform X2 [Maniola jurtina]|uniref:protein CASC3-like isoform X2 n=1 Tax=Maniola jurtina TaxID=191418 RepID=UPI001E686387|nr:protein CASC3-like isoform X2 [Maniola jurtina]